jgi:hypothetical protein
MEDRKAEDVGETSIVGLVIGVVGTTELEAADACKIYA